MKTPEPAPAPVATPIRAYVEGGDSDANDRVLSDARQKLHGVTRVAIHATNADMAKQLTNLLQHQGITVADGADTIIDFDGVLDRLGRGKKRRSARATITRDGHAVFRYELPAEEYRVGDTPVEAFARVLSDALK